MKVMNTSRMSAHTWPTKVGRQRPLQNSHKNTPGDRDLHFLLDALNSALIHDAFNYHDTINNQCLSLIAMILI